MLESRYRLFDVETSPRIAEFKLARWDGHDGGRQQPTVKDLVRLAADTSGRTAELYVRGSRPRSLRCVARVGIHDDDLVDDPVLAQGDERRHDTSDRWGLLARGDADRNRLFARGEQSRTVHPTAEAGPSLPQ